MQYAAIKAIHAYALILDSRPPVQLIAWPTVHTLPAFSLRIGRPKDGGIPGNQVVKIAELNGKFLEKLEHNLKVNGGNNFH
jgi:hypothetical protein